MDFLAPRGVNRLSCASGAAFKDNWQLSQAQLGEFIFVLNRQAGLPLKMNIERLGRGEQRGRGSKSVIYCTAGTRGSST